MKPKDLPHPYSWKERKPLLWDKIFYVPDHYSHHQKETFPSFERYFKNQRPIHLEYCSGNGEWILERALSQPHMNWVAVEMWFKRVRKIYSKVVNRHVDNLLIIAGEGLTFSRAYLPDQCLDNVYINFPDPWPKKRHAKHRIIQAPFVQELKRTVKRGGEVTLVTDDTPYKEQIEREMKSWHCVKRAHTSYGSSFFERLWRARGRAIHHLCYANH